MHCFNVILENCILFFLFVSPKKFGVDGDLIIIVTVVYHCNEYYKIVKNRSL